jgi:hypothetical protein
MAPEGLRLTDLRQRMFDEHGNEWRAKRARWSTLQQADAFVRRGQGGGVVEASSSSVSWLSGPSLASWWESAHKHFESPGKSILVEPDDNGLTWGAHVWRDKAGHRMIVFEEFC